MPQINSNTGLFALTETFNFQAACGAERTGIVEAEVGS